MKAFIYKEHKKFELMDKPKPVLQETLITHKFPLAICS